MHVYVYFYIQCTVHVHSLILFRSLDRIRYVRRTLTGDHYRRGGRRDPSDRRHYSVIIHNSSPVGRANGRGIDLTSSCVVNGQSQPASPALDQAEPLVRPHHLGLEQFMQRYCIGLATPINYHTH